MERMFRCRRSRNEPPLITLNPRVPPFPSSLKSPMPDSFQNRDDNNKKNNSISNKFLLPRKPPDRMLPYNKAYNHDEDDDEEEGVTEDDEEHNFLHNDEKRKQELDKSMQKPNILVAFLQSSSKVKGKKQKIISAFKVAKSEIQSWHSSIQNEPCVPAGVTPGKPNSTLDEAETALSALEPATLVPLQLLKSSGTKCIMVKLSGSISSQYLTALLMAAPLALGDVEIEIIDKLITIPYVDMTLKLMERFRVHVEHSGNWDRFLVHGGQKYKSPGNAFVEGDASSASYFLAGAAVTGRTITVVGCGTSSLQNHPAVVVPRLPAGLNLLSPGERCQD
ncbi:hypothetical protein S83_066314 [Arachis hypogaea]